MTNMFNSIFYVLVDAYAYIYIYTNKTHEKKTYIHPVDGQKKTNPTDIYQIKPHTPNFNVEQDSIELPLRSEFDFLSTGAKRAAQRQH